MNQSTLTGRHTRTLSAPHPFIKWFAGLEFPQRATGLVTHIEQRRFL